MQIERIAHQLRTTFEGEAWHGPNITQTLAGVTAEQAATRPISGAHTIWELVLHMIAWKDIVGRKIRGEHVTPTPEEDWPPVANTDEIAWRNLQTQLRSAHDNLLQTLSRLKDANLNDPVPDQTIPIYEIVHGVIQHDLYHLGQIALLKKALLVQG